MRMKNPARFWASWPTWAQFVALMLVTWVLTFVLVGVGLLVVR